MSSLAAADPELIEITRRVTADTGDEGSLAAATEWWSDLRIIYGPDYTEPANLDRLRTRNLGHKRSLALREYALGLDALDRAAQGEPLWRVQQCVFAVLALESEPVDPRL